MNKDKVRLSKKGSDYLKNRNRSLFVGAVLRSIEDYSAEVLHMDENIIHVKLSEQGLSDLLIENNNFAVHRDHLIFI